MNIIMYTKTGCPWCNEARNLLDEREVEYEEREVKSNLQFYKELVEKSGQDKTPTFDIDGVILADSDVDEIREYLDSVDR